MIMRRRKTIFDDGFQDYLTIGATLVGAPGIPMMMDLQNVQVPKDMIPFTKARKCANKRQYVHFYMHDREFSRVLTSTNQYLDLLKLYDGVITPDCTMAIGQSPCLQQANTYMNRAVGFFLQKNGIPVIPNVRWSDESSFEYCFLGVPKGAMVSVSTHGCITSKQERQMFKTGIGAMLDAIQPNVVLVHGYMPDDIFGEYTGQIEFHRYASQFERTHMKEGA
jgi:hypothetical protein